MLEKQESLKNLLKRASLVDQLLIICLARQEDTSWIPGPETPHPAGQLSLRATTSETCKPWSPSSKTREDTAVRSPRPQQRPRAAKNKFKLKNIYIYIYILQNYFRETRILKNLL